MTADGERELSGLLSEGAARLAVRDFRAAGRASDAAIALAEGSAAGDSVSLVRALLLKSKCLSQEYGPNQDRAIPHASRALGIAQGAGMHGALLAEAYGGAGSAFQSAGRIAEAREMFRRAHDVCISADLPDAYFYLTCMAIVTRDLDPTAAVPLWRRLVEMDAESGPESTSHMMVLSSLGECLLAAGMRDEAIAHLEHALAILERSTSGAPHRWVDELRERIAQARIGK